MHYPTSWRAGARLAALMLSTSILSSPAAYAGPVSPAPPLPAPSGTVLHVSTEAQLQTAMSQLRSYTTIVLAPGTYRLTRTLYINGSFVDVGVRGATNNPADVVLVGPGMTNGSYGSVPHGIWSGGNVQGVTIANMTIRDFYFHPIIFNGGTQAPLVHNVRLLNAGEQFIKSNPDGRGGGVNNGVVQYTSFDYTNGARDNYPKGVDVHTGANWVIRHNLFRNLRSPNGQLIGPAVLIWNGSRNATVESNTFINCQREIMLGVYDKRTPNEHAGGVIRNNMIYRASSMAGDVGIAVFDSPDTQVLHNTIIMSGTYNNAIEYRYPGTMNVYIANNLVDGLIRQRDGAHAVIQNNVTNAHAGLFVDAAAGNLHLRSDAVAAIDRGILAAGVLEDWDGDTRPQGGLPDIGADEVVVASAPAPAPAPSPEPTPTNQPPTIWFRSPLNGSSIALGTTVGVVVRALDADGTIARVQVLRNGSLVYSGPLASYSTQWTPTTRGTYTFEAIATDNLGATTRATPVRVTVY
jgi:hypothetical protein